MAKATTIEERSRLVFIFQKEKTTKNKDVKGKLSFVQANCLLFRRFGTPVSNGRVFHPFNGNPLVYRRVGFSEKVHSYQQVSTLSVSSELYGEFLAFYFQASYTVSPNCTLCHSTFGDSMLPLAGVSLVSFSLV